jgi:hypothetical protein
MSTTNNVQSFLPYVFRPTYGYSPSNGFSTTFNIRNIDTISAKSLSVLQLQIGDTQNNVYLGTSSGNALSALSGCNTFGTTVIGVTAGAGQSNTTNIECIGYGACQNIRATSNSTFIGTLAGSNASNVNGSLFIGTNSGKGSSNVLTSIAIGQNALSNVTAASNVIAIGTNTAYGSANGGSNIYIGNSNTIGLTGTGNIIIGHQVTPPSYSVGGVVTTVPSNMSNKLFIGSGNNVLISGDFVSGCVSIGSTNTTPNSLNGPYYSPILPTGAQIQLDVAKYVRIGYGLGIGVDPGNYAMDVNGQLHVADGSGGDLTFAPPVYGSSDGALTLKSTATGGTMSLNVVGQTQSTGYYTLQSGTGGVVASATTLTIANVLKNNGLLTVTMYSTSSGYYSASFIVTAYAAGTATLVGTATAANISLSLTSSPPNLVFTVPSGATCYYNITCFPVG